MAPEPVTPEEIPGRAATSHSCGGARGPCCEPYSSGRFHGARVLYATSGGADGALQNAAAYTAQDTAGGEVFADISNPQLSKQGAPVTGVLATSKSRNRLGLMIALALVLIVLLLIAYLYLFQVTDFGFTLGWIGVDLSSLFAG